MRTGTRVLLLDLSDDDLRLVLEATRPHAWEHSAPWFPLVLSCRRMRVNAILSNISGSRAACGARSPRPPAPGRPTARRAAPWTRAAPRAPPAATTSAPRPAGRGRARAARGVRLCHCKLLSILRRGRANPTFQGTNRGATRACRATLAPASCQPPSLDQGSHTARGSWRQRKPLHGNSFLCAVNR